MSRSECKNLFPGKAQESAVCSRSHIVHAGQQLGAVSCCGQTVCREEDEDNKLKLIKGKIHPQIPQLDA